MNAPKDSVSLLRECTTCQAVVASCFDFTGKRNKIVYSDMNFPSVMYFWEAQRQYGAHIHMVKTDDGITVPTERLLGRNRRAHINCSDLSRDFSQFLHQ